MKLTINCKTFTAQNEFLLESFVLKYLNSYSFIQIFHHKQRINYNRENGNITTHHFGPFQMVDH